MIKVYCLGLPDNFRPQNLELDLKTLLGRDASIQFKVVKPETFGMIPSPWLHDLLGLIDGHSVPTGIIAVTSKVSELIPDNVRAKATVLVIDDWGHLVQVLTAKEKPNMIKVHVIDPPRHFNPRNLETDLKTFFGRDLSVQVVVANPPDFKKISEPWIDHQLDRRSNPMPDGILAATGETATRLPEDILDDTTVAVIDDRGHLVKLAGPGSDDTVDLSGDADEPVKGLKVVLLEHPEKFNEDSLVSSVRAYLGQPNLKVEIGAVCLPSSDPNQKLDAEWLADKAEEVGTSLFAASTGFCRRNLATIPSNVSILMLDERGRLDASTFAGAIIQPNTPRWTRMRHDQLCRSLQSTLADLGIRF